MHQSLTVYSLYKKISGGIHLLTGKESIEDILMTEATE